MSVALGTTCQLYVAGPVCVWGGGGGGGVCGGGRCVCGGCVKRGHERD